MATALLAFPADVCAYLRQLGVVQLNATAHAPDIGQECTAAPPLAATAMNTGLFILLLKVMLENMNKRCPS
jgi:hypothetical protein